MTQIKMFIHFRLTQHISGIIMQIVRRDSIEPRLVLAWMCWLRFCGVRTRAERTAWMQVFTQCAQLLSCLHKTACWVNLKWINIFTCVIRWFFLLLCMNLLLGDVENNIRWQMCENWLCRQFSSEQIMDRWNRTC